MAEVNTRKAYREAQEKEQHAARARPNELKLKKTMLANPKANPKSRMPVLTK